VRVGRERTNLKTTAPRKIVLKNGMTVLLMEKRGVPMVSVAAIIKAGAAADPAEKMGWPR